MVLFRTRSPAGFRGRTLRSLEDSADPPGLRRWGASARRVHRDSGGGPGVIRRDRKIAFRAFRERPDTVLTERGPARVKDRRDPSAPHTPRGRAARARARGGRERGGERGRRRGGGARRRGGLGFGGEVRFAGS